MPWAQHRGYKLPIALLSGCIFIRIVDFQTFFVGRWILGQHSLFYSHALFPFLLFLLNIRVSTAKFQTLQILFSVGSSCPRSKGHVQSSRSIIFYGIASTVCATLVCTNLIIPVLDMHDSLKVLLMKFFQAFDVPMLVLPCFLPVREGKKIRKDLPNLGESDIVLCIGG